MRVPVRTVLIVDDSEDNRAELQRLLLVSSDAGYRFVEAKLGAEGIRRCRAGDDSLPDVVLLNLRLPDMSAVDMLAELRDGADFPPCPVVVLTGTDQESGPALLRAGAQDYLAKSWTTAESLHRVVENSIERFALLARRTRKRSVKRSREHEYFLQRLTDVSPGILHVFDLQEQRNVFISRTVASLLGYSQEEVAAMGDSVVPTLMHPDDLARFSAHLERVRALSDNETAEFEHRMRHRLGEWRWFRSCDTVFARDADGAVRKLIGSAIEVTARKEAEEKLQLAESRFELALNGSGIVVYTTDADLRYTWIHNPHPAFRSEDVIGRRDDELLTTQHAALLIDLKQRVLSSGVGEKGEFAVGLDGEQHVYSLTVEPLRETNGAVIGLTVAATDITARTKTEAALAAREAEFRATFEQSGVGMAQVCAKTGRLIRVNAKYCELTGYSADELLAMTPAELTFAEDRTADEPAVTALLSGASTAYENEKRYVRKDGELIWVHINGTLLRDATGHPDRSMAVVQDITARKRAEGELRASEERFRATFASAPVGIAHVGLDGRWLRFNDAVCAITGYSREKLATLTFADITHPEDVEADWMQARKLVAGEIERYAIEKRYIRDDGNLVWVNLTASLLRDADGAPVHFISIVEDITKRRAAVEALQVSEKFTSTVLESSPDCVKVLDGGGRLQFMNANGLCLTEIDDFEKFRGQAWSKLWPEASEPIVRDAVERAGRGETVHFQMFGPTPKGTPKWWDVVVAPVADKSMGLHAPTLICVSRDVTAQREAERELRESEQRLTLGTQVAGLGLVEVDYISGVCHFTARAAQLFGLGDAPLALPRADVHATFHPEDRLELDRCIAQSLESSGSGWFALEHRVIWPTGEVRWLSVRKQVFFTGEGDARRPARAVLAALDVTSAKTAAEAVRDSDERMRLANEATAVGVWEWNVLTNVIRWDAQLFRIYGITPTPQDFVHYSDWSGAVLPEDLAENERILQDTLNRRGQSRREFRIRRRDDGECRVIEAVETVRLNAQGEPEWVLGTNLDITERKRAERKLRQLAAELSAADHRKDEFLATLAHELRNPLAPLRNGLELIKLAGTQSETVEMARSMMERQLMQMVRLVDDLMDVSRISRGKLELRRERVLLEEVLRSAVETSSPLIDQMGHDLTVTLPEQPLVVDADMTRLAQVFLNLLNNAAKYAERNGRIQLYVEVEGSDAVVTVKDNGIGIAADQLTSIFEMFTQGDRSLEKAQGGLGIGLTLVQRLVEMHGGSVRATSDGPGKGSEFVVRLPLAMKASPVHESDAARQSNASDVSVRVLIVDDNRDAADSLGMTLRVLGHDARTAYDGQQGVDLAGEFRPDVIVFDIGLPGLNGFEACRRIRSEPWGKSVVLIALTGWGQDEDRRRSHEAGFDRHLVKPVDPQSLVTILAGFHEAKR